MDVKPKERVLVSSQRIQQKIRELAARINEDYKDKEVLAVCVLKGATVFLADLMRQLQVPLAVDFMAVASYGESTQSTGVVKILKDLDANIESRHVLVVEDIVDSGLTLHYILNHLRARNVASLRVCCLLDKRPNRKVDVPIDYVGFEIDNAFVVGYGLDYQEKYRNVPYVFVMEHPYL